ncbi:MAG TPA: L-threonylcarbamoyladenylate synthase [Chthoniobacterales bacterium]
MPETVTLSANDPGAVAHATSLLLAGEVVALPTETVYGLAGNALNPEAVARIFAAKRRPFFDPLIVHVDGAASLDRLVRLSFAEGRRVRQLTERFWPGPLTLVLPRTAIVPDLVTNGSACVAVRAPDHPVFQAVLRAAGCPLAAPSANRFGRISPTTADHVREELDGEIPLIIDGGLTRVGLESTIVRSHGAGWEILRPGPVSAEDLAPYGPVQFSDRVVQAEVPGQLPSHYAPRAQVVLIDGAAEVPGGPGTALLAWGPVRDGHRFALSASLSETRSLTQAAARLFRCLREVDVAEVQTIYAERVPAHGLGVAIMDRLTRAAARRGGVEPAPAHGAGEHSR